ncbi:methyltransferase [Pseudonocardia xinjiangensis]|uniref:methyltransferase n=1 Tax=Pseudonocardia xinjiangensis TaxID=75289 RepID=UPI003D94BCBF
MARIPLTDSAEVDAAATEAAAILELLTGGWVAQTLRAMASLNVADHVAAGAATAEEVAERENADPRTMYRLMRAVSSLGLLSHQGARRFALTTRGHMLRSDVPGSLRALVLIQNEHAHWQSWEHFPDAVRAGRTQVHKALGADLFEYFAKPENSAEAALFARAMGDLSGLVTHGVVANVDTAGVASAVDVGGADGDLILGLMAQDPGLHGQVLELPHAVDGALREARKRGLADRFTATAGDFFTTVPAADLYLLKMIMHDWDDDQCTTILRNCREAVNEGGHALVVEMVIGELGRPDFATRVDMNMLNVMHGMEREMAEYDALFAASGWRRVRDFPVGGGYSVLELVPS